MSDSLSIEFKNVEMSYKLYSNSLDQAVDFFHLNRVFFWKRIRYKLFNALSGINIKIEKGDKVGLIGRNGAGKTTLLNLTTRNYYPTKGHVEVNGSVQSLMDTGVGFHPDYTGYENIKASLLYNGLSRKETQRAIDDIVDFVELGDFLHQPIKTYSLGMLSRLGFATATAIKPDILIIDEVLGAGDAYFMAKSAARMKTLTGNRDTTLLLVSHSSSQILQFCERGIWIDQGAVVEDGPVIEVIKKYDKFIVDLENEKIKEKNRDIVENVPEAEVEIEGESGQANANVELKVSESAGDLPLSSEEKVSRWAGGNRSLQITDFKMFESSGTESYVFHSFDKVTLSMTIKANKTGNYDCIFHFYIYTLDGVPVSNHLSEKVNMSMEKGEDKTIRMIFDSLLLNNASANGEYVVTAGLYKKISLNDVSDSEYYDLLDRSFRFKVIGKYRHDFSVVSLPNKWEL